MEGMRLRFYNSLLLKTFELFFEVVTTLLLLQYLVLIHIIFDVLYYQSGINLFRYCLNEISDYLCLSFTF